MNFRSFSEVCFQRAKQFNLEVVQLTSSPDLRQYECMFRAVNPETGFITEVSAYWYSEHDLWANLPINASEFIKSRGLGTYPTFGILYKNQLLPYIQKVEQNSTTVPSQN